MNQTLMYPGIAIIISICGFLHTLYRDRKVAQKAEFSDLEATVTKLEARVATLEQEKKDWREERVELLARIVKLQNAG